MARSMKAALALGKRMAVDRISLSSSPLLRFRGGSISLSSSVKCAVADQMLLDESAKLEVASLPSFLQRRVVVYDGVCHLCHSGVKWVIQADKDKKIKFCCLQSKAAEPYLRASGLERDDVLRRFLFVEGPGSYHQGSSAPLRDAVYDYVAKKRYNWFGKDNDCLVLRETELLERFIDWEELLERSKIQQM